MKPKKKRVTEVPPSIRSFIDGVAASPLEDIELMLRDFVWEYDKGDFNHWTELFNLFDSYLDKYIGPRKDLSLEDGFLEADMPFPRGPVLQILRISRLISEHCSNRHLVSSFERHLASLLSSTDADIVEASLQTLMAFTNKSISKNLSVRTGSLASKLFTLSQGWGGKDGALGLVACSLPDHLPSEAGQFGSTLHFEFYSTNNGLKGLRVIHMPDVNLYRGSDLELLAELIKEHDVPVEMRFSLLTRLRFARAFGSLAERCRYVCIRLYAFVMLVHVGREHEDVETLLGNEPEFIDELLSLLNYDEIPEKIRVLAILSLAALCQDRSHTPTAIYSVTSGAHSSVLPGLLQKTIDSITTGSTKCSVIFAEALLSLVLVLVSSTPGSLALQESGLISTILPLLKDTNPQHLLLVTTAVQVVEGLLDYHNPSSAVFRDLGGLDDSILRLKSEISVIESVSVSRTAEQEPSISQESSRKGKEPETALVQVQAAHSDSLFLHNRRALIKALLRTISLATYVPGATARVGGSEESVLPHCLCAIFKRGKEFGGGVFSLGAHVMMDLIHKDPTCFPALEAAGLPGAFIDVITNGPLCSSDAVTCIPPCLEALCLNGNGLQMVKERNALRCFLRIFTSKSYLKALNGEAAGVISNGLDELLRHAPTLRPYGVDAVIWILDSLAKIGSGSGSSSASGLESPSTVVPMDIDKPVEKDQMGDASITVESFLPGCISNIVRLLEPIVQNSDTCRMFVEKKGVEKVLQLFDLECIPVSLSIGNSISSAFKNFSATQSVAMLRIVGSFIREQLKSVNGVLSSAVSGSKLDESEPAKQMEVLRSLSGLEGLLVLSSFLLKNNTVMMAELAVAEAEILKELAKIYVETTWQLSLLAESKPDEDLNGLGQEPGTCRDDSIAIVSEREIGGEASTEPASSTVRSDGISTSTSTSTSSSSSSMEAPLYNWNADEALASMVRSAASMHRNGHRHGRLSSLARLRGGARLTRHLEALHAHSDTEGPVFTLENYISLHTGDNKSPDCHVREVLTRLAAAIHAFLLMVVKSLPGRRRTEPTLNPASRSVLTALSRLFLTALSYSGHSTPGFESSLSVKCCYLGKVSDDMSALTFDSWRRACNTSVVNGFYVTGTFKELLTTFEATSQLLWSFPFSTDGKSPNRPSWLLETLQSYCKLLEYYVNSSFLLSPSAPQSTQLLVQPVATELSINLFPVPRDPEGFVSMLQSQVLEAVLPVWNHPVLPTCPATILSPLISIMDHIFSGVGEFKLEHGGSGGVNPRLEMGLSIDETTVSTIVEMGFSRARVEEALRNVGSNSVELATDWLFMHPEELVQEDVQLAQALALSLGSNSEPGEELADRPSGGDDMAGSTVPTPALPLDDVLSVSMKLFQNYGESVALPLGDLLVTLCNRNKGEGRLKVVIYLVQQLKVCPVGPGMDVSLLYPTAHMLALLLAEDGNTREIAAREGLIPVVLRILNFFWSGPRSNDALAEKAMSTLLLVLGSMLQQTPIKNTETPEEPNSDGMDKSKEKHVDFLCTVLGKPTGYLTDEESQQALTIACELVKQHVPAVVMQAALQLCARLTKTYSLSTLFLETGGLSSLFNLPSGSIFPGFDSVASVIVRHVIEDPQTLQSAMELEIKHALSGAGTLARNGGRVSPQSFLTSMAPLICRDPSVFMKAAAAVCQVDSSSGGRLNVVLVKDNKEKDKDRHENKSGDASTPGRLSRVHKRVPPSLCQVMDQLLELIISYEPKAQESSDIYFSEASFDDKIVPMEIDEPNPKGKSKVDDMGESERSACMARVSLVLKLLSEMLLMYSHTALVLLKRDSEMSQMRGNCGILYHILHNLLPLTTKDSKDGSDLLAKLSGRATSFLVALCGRSTEGRRRVVSEIVRAFTSLLGGSTGGTSSSTSGPSNGGALVPDKRVWSWCNLVNMILLCNSGSPSSNLSLGCSPDVARAMIDGGMVQSLATVLRALDLDNPHAASICNLILKSLETLTRAANATEPKSDKNKTGGSDHGSVLSIREPGEVNPAAETGTVVADDQETERDQQLDGQDFATEDTGICMGMSMDRGDSENPHELARSGLVVEEDVGEDEEEEEEEDEDEEDDDDRDDDMGVAGRGAHLIPLADTNPVDEEEYNDDMIEEDEDDDELIPNRGVIEVRWQGGATGLDQIRLPPEIRVSRGRGFIEIASESFPGDDADDLYNLHPPFGVERRRQPGASAGSNRSALLSRQRSDFVSGFQHPLVARPPRENTSRDNRLHPVSRWRMFDNGMPPDGSLFSGDRLVGSGASSQLLGFSLGMESLRIGGRRGTGFDGRWTENGQPPASSQAAAIAQAIEDHFVSQIQVVTPSGSSNPYPSNSNPGQSGDQVETDPLVNVPILPSASPMLDVTLNGGNNAPLSENIPVTGEQDDRLMPNELNRDASSDMDSGRSSCHAVIIGTQPVPELSDAHVNSDADASACANSVGIEVPEVSAGANSVEIEASEVNDGYRTPPVPMDSIVGYETPPVPIEFDVNTNAATAPDDADAEADPPDVNHTENNVDGTNEIDPTFLEALPEDLRAEVLASQQGRQAGGSVGEAETGAGIASDAADEIDPEFLAALPPDLQAEVLAQQRAQRIAQSHQSIGQPVDMDNASIIATFPPEIREEVLLTSSEAVLSALPSTLLAEAQMLRDRELSRYRSRGSLFGGSQHRLGNSGRRFALDNHHHQSVMDRGVGVSLVRRVVPTISSGSRGNSNTKEVEGVPLFDAAALEALIRLFQLAQPLSKGILQRVMLNLCAHSITRRLLIGLIVSMIRPEAEGPGGRTDNVGYRRLYGCQCNVVYAQPQSPTGLPPLVLRQLLEILTFLASSHASVADILSCSDLQSSDVVEKDGEEKGKDVNSDVTETPLMLFLKLLNTPLFLRSRLYIELVMSLLEVVVNNAVSKIDLLPESDNPSESGSPSEIQGMEPPGPAAGTERPFRMEEPNPNPSQPTGAKQSEKLYHILVGLPEPDLRNLCTIMSREGLPDKVYTLAAEVIKKLASVAPCHRKFFSSELATVARSLSSSAVSELSVLRSDQNLGLHSSLAGSAILRVLQSLCTLNSDSYQADEKQQQLVLSDLNSSLEPMWQELSECITVTESKLGQTGDLGPASQPLPPGAQRLLPFIESFFVLCEKLQLDTAFQLENISSSPRTGGTVTFARVAEKHRRLLNLFIRQNPSLLEKSLSMMLKVPRLIDFDNKRAYFRSRIRQQHDNLVAGPIRISVRRAYVLEDSYNQLRLRRCQDLKGRLTVQFQGEEGIDAGGLTREWYQLLSRVIFDKGALLFTTVGNNASFQPNANSVYQTEHLSYFKFVGRVVAKALFDGQLLDVHFTRSFYKHMLGVKVTYHDIEAVDPDYYKNLKWMLENDVNDIPDLTFSMDADEEKHILYEKNQVTDHELKPGGRNIRVTEETKHEYVDLVADHILTNAIRPQINAFLEGFTELIPRELISIFNDKELELLISGLPEIDLNDLKANSEYIGYSAASPVIQWFWEVVKGFNKEDRARLLQFVTGTSKVPLEGFKALQGISAPQRFQIHKAYGAPDRLPSAHTCFNQLDLPEYNSKEQLEERLLLAIHEASEGFGFG